jgi:general stress protein YciG
VTLSKKARAGKKGGLKTGPTKRRDVDYRELGRLGGLARRAKKGEVKV